MEYLCDINDLLKIFNENKKEDILSAIEKLDNTKKKIISMRYGINGYNSTSIINISRQLNLEYYFVNNSLRYSINFINNILKNPNWDNNPIFNSLLKSYDACSKDDIIKAIYQLNEPKKTIIILSCGLDGVNLKTTDIGKMLGLDEKKVYTDRTVAVYEIGKILINNFSKYKLNKAKEKLSFNSTEEFVDAINQLDKYNEKLVLQLFYGINTEKPLDNNQIASYLKITPKKVVEIKSQAISKIKKKNNK